jgi:ribosomal protein S18 acetylase RimI-like enzyme
MRIEKKPKITDIKKFIESNPNGRKKFRYFDKRNFEIIESHLKTLLMFENEKILGYSHLDKEGDDVWFGIIICDECVGLGYGSILMKETFSDYDGIVKLSVDKDNISAINLYKKNNFKILESYNDYYIMIKN